MNTRVRYTVNDVKNNRFFQMPKFLFEGDFKDKLNNDSRVLYSLLRDRHELSLLNNWVNENNEVFFIYSREEMADMLGVSQPTLRKAIMQLKQSGLMEEERIGLNRANRIYITAVDIENPGMKKSFTPECKELSHRNEKPFQSEWKNSFSQECKKLSPNDTDINNTEINHTDIQSINHDSEEISESEKEKNISMSNLDEKPKLNSVHETYSIEYLREQFETAILEQNNEIYKELTELIYDVVNYTGNTIKVNGYELPAETVKSRFLKLNVGHLQYVVNSLEMQKSKIHNIRQYLITTLYNSYTTIGSYYDAAVRHDFSFSA